MNVNNKKSFTLIELIVVIFITGLLFNIVLTKNKIKKEELNVTNFKENILKIDKSFFYFCDEVENKIKCFYLIGNTMKEDKNNLFKDELPKKFKTSNHSFIEDEYFIIFFNNYLYSEKLIFEYNKRFYLMNRESDKIIVKDDISELNNLYFELDNKINNIDIGK